MLPLLPPWLRDDIVQEHQRILSMPGFEQRAALRHHAKVEEIRLAAYVETYIPRPLWDQLVAQHDEH